MGFAVQQDQQTTIFQVANFSVNGASRLGAARSQLLWFLFAGEEEGDTIGAAALSDEAVFCV